MIREPHNCPSNYLVRPVDSPFLSGLLLQVPIITSLRPRDRSYVQVRLRIQHDSADTGERTSWKGEQSLSHSEGLYDTHAYEYYRDGGILGFLAGPEQLSYCLIKQCLLSQVADNLLSFLVGRHNL